MIFAGCELKILFNYAPLARGEGQQADNQHYFTVGLPW